MLGFLVGVPRKDRRSLLCWSLLYEEAYAALGHARRADASSGVDGTPLDHAAVTWFAVRENGFFLFSNIIVRWVLFSGFGAVVSASGNMIPLWAMVTYAGLAKLDGCCCSGIRFSGSSCSLRKDWLM